MHLVLAHVAGIPVEETVLAFAPVAGTALLAVPAGARARLRAAPAAILRRIKSIIRN